jgi:SAM-dependent methyltransferase
MTEPYAALSPSDRLQRFRDHPEELRTELLHHPERLVRVLRTRYSCFPDDMVREVVRHFQAPPLVDNPLAMRYIDSEFAVVDAQLELMHLLDSCGLGVRGRTVLDIGCSNGALLYACFEYGATSGVGVDISEARLINARRFLAAQPFVDRATVACVNLLEEDLPEGMGPFQVILSTNVLEHVPSVPKFFDAVRRHLSHESGSYALAAVGNKFNLTNVLSEPHYGIPGLVLLPREEAARIWTLERTKLSSDQPYEVYDWFLFDQYQTMARTVGLEADLLLDKSAFDTFDAIRVQPETFARRHGAETMDRLVSLKLSTETEHALRGALEAYWSEFVYDHRTAGRSRARARVVFLKYHVYMLRLLLRHPGFYGKYLGRPLRALLRA